MQKERQGSIAPARVSTRLIRSYNVVSILQVLYQVNSCSRIQLTAATKMSPSTVTRIITQLLEKKIITEEGMGESNGGRKPIIIRLNYDKLYIVGLQIRCNQIIFAISDLKGTLVRKEAYNPHSLAPIALIEEVVRKIEKFLEKSGIDREYVLGIGIVLSGIVQEDKLLHSRSLGWRGVNLVKPLEDKLGLEIVVENDVNAAALAELWFGDVKNTPNFLFLKLGSGVDSIGVESAEVDSTSVRAAMIYERRLLSKGTTGEIGHIPIKRSGQRCRCGQIGCLETYLNPADLIRRYQKETGKEVTTFSELFKRAEEGEEKAEVILEEAISVLSMVVAFTRGFLDFDTLVIDGEWAGLGKDFFIRLQGVIQRISTRARLGKVGYDGSFSVYGSKLGEDAALLSAVGLVINKWFTPPVLK